MAFTIGDIARITGLNTWTVRRRADTVWKAYVERNGRNRLFTRVPPTTLRAQEPKAMVPRGRGRPKTKFEIPNETANVDHIDVRSVLGLGQHGKPTLQIDWALRWAERGVFVFPCVKFLGDSLVEWHLAYSKGGASKGPSTVVSWWSQWPDADIAAVPYKSGHFVVVAIEAEGGYDSLEKVRADLPKLDWQHWHPWNGEHQLWFKSSSTVATSHHKLGAGLHVIGAGGFVFLPNSRAPFFSLEAA